MKAASEEIPNPSQNDFIMEEEELRAAIELSMELARGPAVKRDVVRDEHDEDLRAAIELSMEFRKKQNTIEDIVWEEDVELRDAIQLSMELSSAAQLPSEMKPSTRNGLPQAVPGLSYEHVPYLTHSITEPTGGALEQRSASPIQNGQAPTLAARLTVTTPPTSVDPDVWALLPVELRKEFMEQEAEGTLKHKSCGAAGEPLYSSQEQEAANKWNSVGWQWRGEVPAATKPEGAWFLISFASGNKERNDAYLHRLREHGARSSLWDNELKRVSFCTDRSIGTGAHFVDGEYKGRNDPQYDWLGKPWEKQENTVFPGWFEIYRDAYQKTKFGYLLLNFTREYMKSKACRWEFGFLNHDRLYVYIHEDDRIISWQELVMDEDLMRQVLGGDAQDIAEEYGAEEKLQDSHCEQPFRKLLLELAALKNGADSLEWASAAIHLGIVELRLGHAKEAQHLLDRALTIKEGHYGKYHLRLALTLNNLATAYGLLGEPEKNRQLLERALVIQEQHFGRNHFSTAITLSNLGNAYMALGDLNKSIQLLERALFIEEQHFGKDHFQLTPTLGNLSNAYGALADPEKQKQLLERALAIKQRHYSKDHAEMAPTLCALGIVYGVLGDSWKQKRFLENALVIQERHYGKDHFEVATTLDNLGEAYAYDDPEKQRQLLHRALSIKQRHYGMVHLQVAKTLGNLSNAYHVLGDFETQKQYLERANGILTGHYGGDHHEVAMNMDQLGNAFGELGDRVKQMQLQERALCILEQHFGKDHFQLAPTLANLGNAYYALRQPSKQRLVLRRAVAILGRHFGENNLETANALFNYGCCLANDKEYDVAAQAWMKVLPVWERRLGNEHFKTVRLRKNLASLEK